MPSELVRITIDKQVNNYIVEYGTRHPIGLTEAQREELDLLENELMEYQDFSVAEELEEEERQALMEKKQRFEALRELESERIEWVPVEARLIDSVLLILKPEQIPIYVENLPSQMLRKLMEPQLTLNWNPVTGGVLGAPRFPTSPRESLMSANMERVIAVLNRVTEVDWTDWLDVTEEAGVVHIRPKKYLKEKWPPINTALKAAFGNDIWKSKGKGDKQARWEIAFK